MDYDRLVALEKRFNTILMKGIEENPPSINPQRKGKRGKNPKTRAKNLLDRFIEDKEKILNFLNDFKVPFENNQAERDIRMMKLQQKISGTFRTTKEPMKDKLPKNGSGHELLKTTIKRISSHFPQILKLYSLFWK